MPVRRGLALAAAALLVLVAACDGRGDRKKVTPPVLVRPTAPAAGPVDPAFLGAARKVRDAATRIASGCRLYSSEAATGFDRYTDHCSFLPKDLAALRATAAELAAFPPGTSGAAALFAEEARLFTAFVELSKDEGAIGTVSHYQGLASAWNSLKPDERIPVDSLTKDPYTGRSLLVGDAGAVVWSRCSTGPCIVVPSAGR